MKKVFRIVVVAQFIGLCLVTISHSAVPKLLNYQGKLTDTNVNALTGTYNIIFSIYTAATGGTAIWTETQNSISVSNGLFSTLLGNGTALNLSFDTDYYLRIKVGTDTEMTPRQRLASAGYAINADMLDGLHSTDFSAAGTINSAGNPVDWTKLKSVPAGFADGVDDTGSSSQWTTSGSDIYYNTGNVGIGTTNPTTRFSVLDATFTVLTDERVGIGTIDPRGQLSVFNANANAELRLYEAFNKETTIRWDVANDRAEWDTYTYAYPIYIDASNIVLQSKTSGNVGIGETNPTSQLYVSSWTSSLGYIDRTPYPQNKQEAYESILSSKKKINGEGIDHEALAPFVRHKVEYEKYNPVTKSKDTIVEYGRNLSATVSAQSEVIKDLIKRIEVLEKEVLEKSKLRN